MLKKKRKGQSLVEYTLILSLVSAVAIPSLTLLGQELKMSFEKVVIALNSNGTNSNIDIY